MSDSQRPKFSTPQFEVPDLDLAPAPRSFKQPAPAVPVRPAPQAQPRQAASLFGTPDLFDDDDSITSGTLSLDVDTGPRHQSTDFGGSVSFVLPGDFELDALAQPVLQLSDAPRSGVTALRQKAPSAADVWPSGRAREPEQIELDPIEISILADYGEVPREAQLTPGYAFRVFTRQRELKRQLLSISDESDRAEFEREATLAELARAVRPATEGKERFRRLLTPLAELEEVASQRGRALSSVNAQLDAHTTQLDANRSEIGRQIEAEQQREHIALRAHDEREATAKRACAKLRRVHIEMRAVTQVAEQKLGPKGGQIPDVEAAQLETLQQRADGLQPEVAEARAQFEHAKQSLGQVRARLEMLRHSERQASRKKQALGEHFEKEVRARSEGMTENEAGQRAALADLGRAVLGANGVVDVPEAWLERVRGVSARADKLMIRREMQRRAIEAFDRQRVTQGVRLVCTLVGLLVVLIALKLIF